MLVLPLRVDDRRRGFVAMSATSLEPAAAIVSNLAAAMRSSRLYQEALEGRRLAEEANHLKSRFMSIVSHELHTPLSVVVGLSEMVLHEARGDVGLSPTIVDRPATNGLRAPGTWDGSSAMCSTWPTARRASCASRCSPVDLAEVLATAEAAGSEMAREKGLEFGSERAPRRPG